MKKNFNKILFLLLTLGTHEVFATKSIQQGLEDATNPSNLGSSVTASGDGLTMLAQLAGWFKSEIFSVIMVFSIGVFIFIGMKIIMARGNPEEFKKSMLYFVYAVIGLFFIFAAWGLVRLVSSLSL